MKIINKLSNIKRNLLSTRAHTTDLLLQVHLVSITAIRIEDAFSHKLENPHEQKNR